MQHLIALKVKYNFKKTLDAGALTATEYELIKQRIIDDYYVEKLIKEEISLDKKKKINKKIEV